MNRYTLTAPIAMPDGSSLPGISRAARVRREVDFLFPLAESPSGMLPSGMSEDRWVHDRGFVRGYLDVVFQHNGRIAFADWKSDALPSYTAAAMGAHVESNYKLQVQLYTLAVALMLGIDTEADYETRFGGVVYLFLRGLRQPPDHSDDGVYVCRPTYAEVVSWRRELAAAPAPSQTGAGEP